ncbi:hypothetical protein IAG44_14330 [Streptomyces roseirectus]|uniref:Uncharacterized protein n=1 Tax=Streptomyces roseirectus TaxID=2768066 RepID=A0A7H0ICI6_9ACTN|nr:hypothetical protein [Streptomyces roseirectus]QNP70502.1 hypothetical protein IAG44_14330 [Streptomyces roseirectus]
MDQRIGSSSKPLEGAGFDPAFIPGLTAPVPAEPAKEPEDAVPEEGEAVEAADDRQEAEPETGEAQTEEEAPVDGPVFEAADRRASIVADHKGVRLALDDQNCEFRWDEIGAVETETTRFGKLFTVTVHTPDRRWYPIEIEAKSRSVFPEWEKELDAVLDAYFEDGAEAVESAEPAETEEEA